MIFFLKCLIGITLILSTEIYAKTNATVNVLTWSGYLSEKTTQLIQKKCGATLTYDTYNSNENMLRMWHEQEKKYDVIIFSNTIFNSIHNEIIQPNSQIWKKSRDYQPNIKKHYLDSHFPPNVAFFSHALTGFIWNEKNIHLTENETIESAFSKLKKNKMILLDDPVEINMLLNARLSHQKDNTITLSNLKTITHDADVFISNEINQIYNQPDFALSFQWSGFALTADILNNHYHFLINKNLSYITTDLIAQITDSKAASCTADILSDKTFLTPLQNETNYFSPFGKMDHLPQGPFKDLYTLFLNKLPTLEWLEQPTYTQLRDLNQEWSAVKYELSKNNE